mmetsp:Transcript_13689/g.30659  ORF Transcript_13689/g.30659 Transcript_13689/m.30659 type:complete len:347 (-) Transcript_13689:57-1097(-)
MGCLEFFVNNVQWCWPTLFLRLGVRWYLRLYVGWSLRGGDVVCKQIEVDRTDRKKEPVTALVEKANEQLYGNDPKFFEEHLGPRLKYSACEWPEGTTDLGEAEELTLRAYQDRAKLEALPAGSRVLELGCGWGSLTLANCERFPKLHFVAFSNSPQQIEFIRAQAKAKGIDKNLTLHVEDYADFCTDKSKIPYRQASFDAAFGIETLEHARNIASLIEAVADRLKLGARFFVHSLLHQSASYLVDDGDWMGRNFFSGGSILSLNSYFHLAPPSLYVTEVVPISGKGYSLTLLAWLAKMEANRGEFVARYGRQFYEGYRAFYVVSAEAFAANNGYEYMVAYYTFVKR